MADPDKPQKSKKPGEAVPMERNMLLALALVGGVLFLSQYLYSPSAPQKSGPKQTEPTTSQQAAKPPAPVAAPSTPEDPTAKQPVAASQEQFFTVDTDVYKVVFSNNGAVVRRWELKKYKDINGKPVELVNFGAASKTHFPFSVLFENQKPSADPNQVLYKGVMTAGGLGVQFDYSNGKTVVRKSFRFNKNSYVLEVATEISENGTGIPHLLAWRGGFGDRTAHAAASTMRAFHFDAAQNKLIENDASTAKNGPVMQSGSFSFAGVEDTYFAAAFLPKDNRPLKIQTVSDSVIVHEGGGEEAVVGAAVGGDAVNQLSAFVGPKDLDLMRRVNPKLEKAVDFGWFSILAHPLFIFLSWVNNNWTHNYGWAILVVTILINMALLPLKISGMRGMKKMASLQPEIQAINKKYENIGMRDPRKAEQNTEVMALYKKHGVNPLGAGCMPLLLQIPFFFAFYKVLSIAIELRGAEWLWIKDLSQFDPWYLLPVVMVVTQFVLQKMTPATSADPAQQKMMMVMPLVFGFLFFKSPAGLVLYWLTGNVVSIAQQWFINKSGGPVPTAASATITAKPQSQAKKNVRK